MTSASRAVGDIKQLFIRVAAVTSGIKIEQEDYTDAYRWLNFLIVIMSVSKLKPSYGLKPHQRLAQVKIIDIFVLLVQGVDSRKCQSLLSRHRCDWINPLSIYYTSPLITGFCRRDSRGGLESSRGAACFPYTCFVSFVLLFLGGGWHCVVK